MSFSSTTKYNYIDIVNRQVPEFYRENDYRLFGEEEDISLTFLGKILKSAIQNDLYLDVSTLDTSTVAEWFVPNERTKITSNSFQARFLAPYGLTFDDFRTTEDFKSWVSGTFLPDIEVNNPSGFHSALSGNAFDNYSALSSTHQYCIDHLGLFYFLNNPELSSTTASANASAIMVDYLTTPLLQGKELTTQNGLNSLFRFFWENRGASTYYASFFPSTHASGTSALSGNEYLSGTQMFDAIQVQLETWTDYRIKDSKFFKDSLSVLINGTGNFPSTLRDAGPFQRFLKAISLGISDISLIIEEINTLLSIDDCPEQFLELLANNIGWRFLTGDYTKWRTQLRNAVMMYKTKGSVVGFGAAVNLIFPDGTFAASDVGEAWESYLPKLLYYLIKTESFIKNESLEFASKEDMFNGSWPEDVRFNQAPSTYVDAADKNYRFLVDGILQQMHIQYNTIKIHGRPYTYGNLWKCLPEVQLPNGDTEKGFLHRNSSLRNESIPFYVAVPPWEKYGFYKEAEITPDSLDFLCKTLSGSRNEFGFEINSTYVQGFKTLVSTALNTVYSLAGTPTFGENNKFRFFTDNHEYPPNYSKFVEYGHTSALSDFDVWNTKSSYVFATFQSSAMDYTVDAYDTFKNKAALETFVDIMKELLPLHVVAKITLYNDLEDTHTIFQKLCVFSEQCLDDFNVGYLNSKRSAFWRGASGTGDLGVTYVNGDGRVLPTYVSGASPSGGLFWQVSGDSNLDRNTSRRRGYRYALECYPYTKNGASPPIALNNYKIVISGTNEYLNTYEYNIKGFDYATQSFSATSSVVWDSSGFASGANACDLSGGSGEFTSLSSTYPFRAVPDTSTECSSLNIYRDTLKGILEVITLRKIKDGGDISFSESEYQNFKFGDSVHSNYSIYKNEFSSVLSNALSPNIPVYGGHNFISYAYGPTLWNSDFRYKGAIEANVSGVGAPSSIASGITALPFGYEPSWSSIVGGSDSAGLLYQNFEGSAAAISNRPYFKDAPSTSSLDGVSGVFRDASGLLTNEILSGIQIRQNWASSKSFIVVNNPDRDLKLNAETDYSVTLYNPDSRSLEINVPFNPADIGSTKYNKLRPQSQFKLMVDARTKAYLETQKFEVSITTSGVTDDDGNVVNWMFDWHDKKWYREDSRERHVFEKCFVVSPSAICPETFSAEFNTEEEQTEKSIPCGSVIKSSDVHTSSTGYIVKLKSLTTNAVLEDVVRDGISIFEISIVDTVLNQAMNSFNSSECKLIYDFWDELSIGKYSRNATYSTSSFETSGGSKADYVEILGGANYSVSSSDAGQTIKWYNLDD